MPEFPPEKQIFLPEFPPETVDTLQVALSAGGPPRSVETRHKPSAAGEIVRVKVQARCCGWTDSAQTAGQRKIRRRSQPVPAAAGDSARSADRPCAGCQDSECVRFQDPAQRTQWAGLRLPGRGRAGAESYDHRTSRRRAGTCPHSYTLRRSFTAEDRRRA